MPGRNNGFILGAGYSVTYGHDAATGRFGGLDWTADAITGNVNYGYVENSELLGSVTSGNIATTYTYEPHRNLKTRVENAFSPSVISTYDYRYDELGRRTSVVNTGIAFENASRTGFSKYAYNDRSEVTESRRYEGTDIDNTGIPVDPETRLYEYDPIGNREQATEGTAGPTFYATNALNQYTQLTGAVNADPGYDPDGNMTAYDGKEYAWNGENRLVAVTPVMPAEGDQKVAFVYDYLGRRVKKAVYAYGSGAWELQKEILFVYDGWNLIQEKEVSAAGGPLFDKFYVWGLDLSQNIQGAGGIGGLVCRVSGGEVRHYFYDANGNVGQLVNPADGAVTARYEYDPFGKAVFVDGVDAAGNAVRFSTKYWDWETELYYYGFRYYALNIGRWVNRDPILENGGVNIYSAVNNNMENKNDKLGLTTYEDIDDKVLEYSCDCGGIDWNHARNKPTGIWDSAVGRLVRWGKSRDKRGFRVLGAVFQHQPIAFGIVVHHGFSKGYYVKNNLSMQDEKSIALGIFKEVNEGFEKMQGNLMYQIIDNVIGKSSVKSSFSEEDLPSDLISFYMHVEKLDKEWIGDVCDVVDKCNAKQVWNKNGGLGKNYEWKPVNHNNDCDACKGKSMDWPFDWIDEIPKGTLWRNWGWSDQDYWGDGQERTEPNFNITR